MLLTSGRGMFLAMQGSALNCTNRAPNVSFRIRVSPSFNNPIHARSSPSPYIQQSGISAHRRHEPLQTTRSVSLPQSIKHRPEPWELEYTLRNARTHADCSSRGLVPFVINSHSIAQDEDFQRTPPSRPRPLAHSLTVAERERHLV
jgi:hypothetical protein